MSWLALRSFTKGGIGLKRTTRVFQTRQQIKPYWGAMASLGGLEELPRLVTTPACKRPRSPETGETKDTKRIKGSEKEGEKSSRLLVCFDLEMSDGSFASEIFQIGAMTSGGSSFSCYILPHGNIDWGVTRFVNGIKVATEGERRLVDGDGATLASQGPRQGLDSFLSWLEEAKEEGGHSGVVLVSHGNTDMPALLNNLGREDMVGRLAKVVTCFVDSLHYFQSFHKSWEKHGIAALTSRLLPGMEFKPHDASEDARVLYLCLAACGGESLLVDLLSKAVPLAQAAAMAARMVAKTLAKNPKRKNKSMATLGQYI